MRPIRLAPLVFAAITAAASTASAQHVTASAHPVPHKQRREETQAELQKEAKLTMADARSMAMRTVSGSAIQAGEIEREGGKLIYSFDMKAAGKSGIDEVNIDAMTGKLVSKQHETPKDERAEAKADAKAAKRKR